MSPNPLPPDTYRSDPGESDPGEPESVALTEAEVLDTLLHGDMREEGLLPYSSNHSFLVVMHGEQHALPAVYKPQRGESPLWDFEWGTLCKRETAAYVVSRALGWDLVPPTVLRGGTRGIGSVQFYVDNDADEHYFTVQEDARFAPTFRRLALFDYVINNADRKSGHCLLGSDARVWAIDHGICFHDEYKLRTVIWEFADEPIEPDALGALDQLRCCLADPNDATRRELATLLTRHELDAVRTRLDRLMQAAVYPSPSPFRRNFPWPPV